MVRGTDLKDIAERFQIEGTWLRAERLGSGHINETWLSEFDRNGRVVRYVHQAINEQVFADVPGLMRNLERVTAHLRARSEVSGGGRWHVLELVPARDGGSWCRDADGRCWRTLVGIERAQTYDVAPSADVAREAAGAFGRFARELADFDPSALVESIPRFHDLDGRIARLRGASFEDPVGRVGRVELELESVWSRIEIADEFRKLRATPGFPVRVAHNDTKVNNALIDDETGKAVAVIDLDTVMPGTLLFDYGDLVRTATCLAPEDERDPRLVAVDPELFAAVTSGYVGEIAAFATAAELDNLLLGARFMTFIIGIRFLTDFIEGDPYFRTTRPDQNLDRARTQLALLRSIEDNAARLEECIEENRP